MKTSLNIGYWNINKLISKQTDKSKDDLFINTINKSDIFGLAEVKCDLNKFHFDNFVTLYIERKSKIGNQSYGRLGILVRNTIRKGVKYPPVKCSEYQWLKLDKTYFGLDKDMYICFIPPQYSSFYVDQNVDSLELLDNDISFYRSKGAVLILGDFNARTATEPDYIINDDDHHLPLNDDYIIDKAIRETNSRDTEVSTRGRELIDLCISSRIRILSGRILGDFKGKFTSYQYNGNSVIDYCLLSEEQLPSVLYFRVEDPILRLSDHAKIFVRLIAKFQQNKHKDCPYSFPETFKGEGVSPKLFNEALQKHEIKSKLEAIFMSPIGDESNINSVVTTFKETLLTAGKVSLKQRKISKNNNSNRRKWFNSDSYKMRKPLDYKGKLLAKYPSDPHVRGKFYKYRKMYSELCKTQRRKYKADLIDKLDNLFENDPKAYWSLLDNLKENKRDSPDSMPSFLVSTNYLISSKLERKKLTKSWKIKKKKTRFANLIF